MNNLTKSNENSHLLVAVGKSSRLDAIRKKADLVADPVVVNKKHKPFAQVSGLNQQSKEALQQAVTMIEYKMNSILATYPAGKKKTFFKLRYGVNPEQVDTLPLQEVFKLLKLDGSGIKYFPLIEKICSDGRINNAE